ncbi:MAG: SPFH domain-containing protein [Oribacterium sp.]|uniref:SPFH domain-containing protein n=1 Tax=Oribacterium sp. oral taxon 078 TaxID=652706 RepID=UPI0001BCC4DE|nr:SPFH domain-containing protein [Oribacterium sp. oral taxon 078]EFE93179.1 SPFH/Band 7/PHB domain protein [Oribacterium sp. oral taxon 078 str. F0262]ERL20863.1 SPFH/Band 7/PHB domain protein [Oribacterium sp. oral taxon 078 str. F0263]
MPFFIVVILFILAIVLLCITVRVVPEARALIIERFGSYHATWRPGLHFLIPFIDHVSKHINLKEQVADFPPQPVITKDNVTMRIDSVVFFVITDPKLYAYGVDNPIAAIENLTATTLRNIIGSMDLDTTLTSRDEINTQMRSLLDVATDPWGIKVNRVELKNILPPDAIREAMEKQMKAEREKREAITLAEAKKQSAVLTAEGNKQAAILNAEADKQKTILAAEAQKEKEIREAEGRAQAIRSVKEAEAEGIRLIRQAGADDAVLKLRSLEAFASVANGRATKIIIPSDLQNMGGLLAGLKETLDTPIPEKND